MSGRPGFSATLSLSKKSSTAKPPPVKRKPIFGQDDDDSDDGAAAAATAALPPAIPAEPITELDEHAGRPPPSSSAADSKDRKKPKSSTSKLPPRPGPKNDAAAVISADLSGTRECQRHADAAQDLDPTIYDYDAAYDTLKAQRRKADEEKTGPDRRPRYMNNLLAAAAVRKRDALIAEEKKIAREREAEGEEFAGKEKFVTEAYKRQQAENIRLEEEEKRREEAEAKKNKMGGMAAFYRDMLDKGDKKHADVVRAIEDRTEKAAEAPPGTGPAPDEETSEKREADLAQEINQRGGSVAINEDGQVVDKRQLLKGGLNLVARPQPPAQRDGDNPAPSGGRRDRTDGRGRDFVGAGGKQAMRERQTRMMENQLEQALKRSRDAQEEEREKVQRAAKSRKTTNEIEGARERYLRRKREAEEAAAAGNKAEGL